MGKRLRREQAGWRGCSSGRNARRGARHDSGRGWLPGYTLFFFPRCGEITPQSVRTMGFRLDFRPTNHGLVPLQVAIPQGRFQTAVKLAHCHRRINPLKEKRGWGRFWRKSKVCQLEHPILVASRAEALKYPRNKTVPRRCFFINYRTSRARQK